MIPNLIVFGNGKGGVFKSSMTANVSGQTALGGWKVLAIDADPQDHLSLNLGVRDQSDHGEGLYGALVDGKEPFIIRDVRPNLDLIPNGERGRAMIGALSQQLGTGDLSALTSFHEMLAPLASQYNLIVVDTAPGEKVMQRIVMAAARWVVVPTKVDVGSREGLDRVCRDILEVDAVNKDVELMGVVGVGLSRASKSMQRRARTQLEEVLGGLAPVFDSFIHTVDRAAVDGMEVGQLAHEYEAEAVANKLTSAKKKYKDRLEEWRTGTAKSYSAAAGGLAEDYQNLTNELLQKFSEHAATAAEEVSA